ncbi:hypothetical protein D3C80_1133210 [compost metagenome]
MHYRFAELRPDFVEAFGDLHGIVLLGAFIEHAHSELCQTGGAIIPGTASGKINLKIKHRQLPALYKQDLAALWCLP